MTSLCVRVDKHDLLGPGDRAAAAHRPGGAVAAAGPAHCPEPGRATHAGRLAAATAAPRPTAPLSQWDTPPNPLLQSLHDAEPDPAIDPGTLPLDHQADMTGGAQ